MILGTIICLAVAFVGSIAVNSVVTAVQNKKNNNQGQDVTSSVEEQNEFQNKEKEGVREKVPEPQVEKERREVSSEDSLSEVLAQDAQRLFLEYLAKLIRSSRFTPEQTAAHDGIIQNKMVSLNVKYDEEGIKNDAVNNAILRKWDSQIAQKEATVNSLIVKLKNGEEPKALIDSIPDEPDFVQLVEDSDDLILDVDKKCEMYETIAHMAEDYMNNVEVSGDVKELYDTLMNQDISVEDYTLLCDTFVDKLAKIGQVEIDGVDQESLETYRLTDTTSTGISIDELIEVKLERMIAEDKFVVLSDKHLELVKKSLKASWSNICDAYNNRSESKPLNISLESWIEGKACDSIIARTTDKFVVYAKGVKEVTEKLKKYTDNRDGNVVESKTYIVEQLKVLENAVVSSKISVETFKNIQAPSAFSTINNEVNNMSRNSHLTSTISDVAKLKKQLKNQKNTIDGLVSVVEEHSYDLKLLGYLDLVGLVETVNNLVDEQGRVDQKINSAVQNLNKALDEKVDGLMKNVQKQLKNKADVKTVNEKIKNLEEGIKDALKDKLELKDLVALENSIKSLEKAFADVEDRSRQIVAEELKEIRKAMRASISQMITRRLNKRLEGFDEDIQKKIEAEVTKQIINGVVVDLDDEQVEKVVDKVIEKIKIAKK